MKIRSYVYTGGGDRVKG